MDQAQVRIEISEYCRSNSIYINGLGHMAFLYDICKQKKLDLTIAEYEMWLSLANQVVSEVQQRFNPPMQLPDHVSREYLSIRNAAIARTGVSATEIPVILFGDQNPQNLL
jgi:hypothetical protein